MLGQISVGMMTDTKGSYFASCRTS